MKAILAIFSIFLLPIILLNFFGGIVGGIWLAILGQWKVILFGLLAGFFGNWILAIPLMLGMIFGVPAAKAVESGNTFLAVIFGFLSVTYTIALMVLWAFLVLFWFMHASEDHSPIPFLLFSYAAATTPWSYMAQKDQSLQGGNPHSANHVFFLSASYIVVMLSIIILGATPVQCLIVLACGMVVAGIMSLFILREEQRAYSQSLFGARQD